MSLSFLVDGILERSKYRCMVRSPLIQTPFSSAVIALKGRDFEQGSIQVHGWPSTCLLHRQWPIRFDFLYMWTTFLSPATTSSRMRLLTSYGNFVQSSELVCWTVCCWKFQGASPLPFSGRGNVRARRLSPTCSPLVFLRFNTLYLCILYGECWCVKRLRVLSQRDEPT
jgi:hypothetical protein